MKKLKRLQKFYPEFIYESYSYTKKGDNLELLFSFLIKPKLEFNTKIIIKDINQKRFNNIEPKVLESLIFHLGLIEMLNYWKLTCSPIIKIAAGSLESEGLDFLKKIIERGMGQYFYENKINFSKNNFFKLEVKRKKNEFKKPSEENFDPKKYLVPIGGGKDSAVVIEILKNQGAVIGGFTLNEQKPQKEIAKIAGLKEKISIKRKLDPKIFSLNKQGFLNGHVPFSAFLAFLGLIIAYLFDYKNISFAWEKSSNEPNLKYKKRWINHQWSKSLEFEILFKNYCKRNLLKNINLFSPLRGNSDLEIAQMFSKMNKYHFYFISCNNAYKLRGKKIKWCGQCSKCLSVFLTLAPFLEEKKMIRIFGHNLFEEKKLLDTLLKMIGRKDFKPFECVATSKEIIKAMKLSIKKYKKNNQNLPYLLKNFKEIDKI